jgi:hypothetical protein
MAKRKGRPLLVAAAGIAFVSFAANCRQHKPVGNLRAPEPTPSVEEPPPPPIEPVGNLRVPNGDEPQPQPQPAPSGSATPAPSMSPPTEKPPLMPVGNLRPPE